MVLDYVPGSTFQLHKSHNRNFRAFEARGSLRGFIPKHINVEPKKQHIRSSATCSLLGHSHIWSCILYLLYISIYSSIFQHILYSLYQHILLYIYLCILQDLSSMSLCCVLKLSCWSITDHSIWPLSMLRRPVGHVLEPWFCWTGRRAFSANMKLTQRRKEFEEKAYPRPQFVFCCLLLVLLWFFLII